MKTSDALSILHYVVTELCCPAMSKEFVDDQR